MRLRNNPNAYEILAQYTDYYINDKMQYKNKWSQLFQNEHPIFIEIGMGKGDFIIENALRYPEINFIGIEKYPSVLVKAVKKLDERKLDNLKIVNADANILNDIFAKDEIDRIYLNFSDPWPKRKHAKRRLTAPSFLEIYKNILKTKGEVILKTDNRILFEYSVISMNQFGMDFIDICLDLHNADGYEDNIESEYERKFSPYGPIYRIETIFKGE